MFKIKKTLKYINSLPFSLTVKHYYTFDNVTSSLKNKELNSPESWDVLRQQHRHFSISENREEWLKSSEALVKKDGQSGALIQISKDIVQVIKKLGITSVFSVGVGGAGLEYQIKKIKPELKLICSDYSLASVRILKKVFFECNSIILFDIKNKVWSLALHEVDPKQQLCLMYRVDTHFTDREWRNVFQNMFDSGIENILFIPAGSLTFRGLFNRWYQRLLWKVNSQKYVFSGYLRTKKAFKDSWLSLYVYTELKCGGLDSWLLKRIIK